MGDHQDDVTTILNAYGDRIQQLRRVALLDPWHGRGGVPRRHRIGGPGLVDPQISVTLLLTFDFGAHSSGWWRNSEYEWCWHASLACWAGPLTLRPHMVDPHQPTIRAWARAVFGDDLRCAWIEPPADPTDPYRTAPQSRYTTHIRVFVDRNQQPIIPTGEVYTLVPWSDGSSPEKVFRS